MKKSIETTKNTKTSSNTATKERGKETKKNVALRTSLKAGIIGTISKFF